MCTIQDAPVYPDRTFMRIKHLILFVILNISVYASIHTIQNDQDTDINKKNSMVLQSNVKPILDNIKKELQADEIIAVVMESNTGKILSMASSNRIESNKLNSESNPTFTNNAIEYSAAPGGTMMPIVFSLLLDRGLVKPNEMIDCHDGNFTLGSKTIEDEQKFKSLSAEDVIVHSSNIGIVQLAQRLYGKEYADGLGLFGFGHLSGINLPNERGGSIPSTDQLDNYLYKAIVSYGYGVNTTIMQMVKAYNVFNNSGQIVTPFIHQKSLIQKMQNTQVITPKTAKQMKQILIKTVDNGTGTSAKTSGLEIGGKTGTAFIIKDGNNANVYTTSFVGFVNDDKHSYTIGITVIEPRTDYFASITSVPVFKAIVDMMIEEKYLESTKVKNVLEQ